MRRVGLVAAAGLCLAATAAPAAAPEPAGPDDLVLKAGGTQARAQFETGCLPDPDAGTATCVDGEPRPLRATLRVAGGGRRVETRLALPARQLSVVLERRDGRVVTLRARAAGEARDVHAFTLPRKIRSGDVLRIAVRYERRGNATFLARLRVARCR